MTVDSETGEIVEEAAPPAGYMKAAAGGEVMQTIAHTAGDFLDMLEDGRYSHDVHMALQSVAATMTDITDATGNKTKGKVVLTLDLEKDGAQFTIRGAVKATPPSIPRPKSVMWQQEDGAFSRFPPNQMQMFNPANVRRV